jgi:hypothetical protein
MGGHRTNLPKLSTGAFAALITTAILLTVVTAGVISTQTLPSNGTISAVNVGVYSDYQCTTNCTSISWGSLQPDDEATRTVYVKNTGSVPITITMTTENWAPTSASSVLDLTWNRQNYVLNSGQSVSAALTLAVDSDTGSLTNFSFDIIITGAE